MLPTLALQPGWLGKKYKLDSDADADTVLDRMQTLGIGAIEGGSSDPQAFKRKLDARGLRYSGTHMALSGRPNPDQLFDYLHRVGGSDLINSGLLRWGKLDAECYRASIEQLNELARRAKTEGVRFHYHNHAFEFDVVAGGKTGMELLLEGLDWSNDHLKLCVDVAWVWRGKLDAAEFLKAHADKIGYVHLKDTTETEWRELGAGKVDFASIFQVLPDLTECRWAAIEQDETDKEDPLESVEISRRFLGESFAY